jgi:hypothetical protein
MNNERLRELYLAYATSRRPSDRRDCPSTRELVRSFDPSFSRRLQRRIVDHISECPYCREEFMLLMGEQRSEASRRDLPAQGYSKEDGLGAYRRVAWRYATILIGIGLALSAYLIVIQQKNPSGIQRTSTSTITLVTPRAGQVITGQPHFRWEQNSSAEYYILEIFDDQMMPIWTSARIRVYRFSPPQEVAPLFVPGGTYFWMVTGFTPNSEKLESGLSLFRIGH